MLFNKICGCTSLIPPQSRNNEFDRRDLLCAGGAGFITALVAALIGASKIALAQVLGRNVPQVDRLAVRIVTDNYVFSLHLRKRLKTFRSNDWGHSYMISRHSMTSPLSSAFQFTSKRNVAPKFATSLSISVSRPQSSSTIWQF